MEKSWRWNRDMTSPLVVNAGIRPCHHQSIIGGDRRAIWRHPRSLAEVWVLAKILITHDRIV